ncbi:dTDP-4-dehydrorhamnose reductase [Ensifer canadensis]
MRRILVTGGTGQVGTELLNCKWPNDIEVVAPTRAELDLGKFESIESYVAEGNFVAIINPGAYTAVDKAEADVLQAWKVNALAPAALAMSAKCAGIPIIHISTDYVFDGSKPSPYVESDPVAPLGVYGASKEAGEQAIRTANPRHVILRTAWVFSEHGSNFVKTMLRLRSNNSIVRVVGDQVGTPTSAKAIAQTVAKITSALLENKTAKFGTYHFSNEGEASWFEFAAEVFRICEVEGFAVPKCECITSAEFPTVAKRPSNSRLSLEKIKREYEIVPEHWRDALIEVLHKLLRSDGSRGDAV